MMTHRDRTSRPAIALLIALAGACGSGDGGAVATSLQPGLVERPAILDLYGRHAEVDLPDTAAAGEPFFVRVTTFGGHCIRKSRADVSVSALRIEIAPFDSVRTPGPNEVCEAYLEYQVHELELTLPQAGQASVTVRGRRLPGDGPFSLTRSLRVIQR